MPGSGVTTGGDTFNQDRWIRFGNPDIQNLPAPQDFLTSSSNQTITSQMLVNSIVAGAPTANVTWTLDTTANILAALKKFSDISGPRIGDTFGTMMVNYATANTVTVAAGDAKTTVKKATAIAAGTNQVLQFYINDPTGASTPSITVYG